LGSAYSGLPHLPAVEGLLGVKIRRQQLQPPVAVPLAQVEETHPQRRLVPDQPAQLVHSVLGLEPSQL
jgi:hypothetical protein